MVLDLFAGDQGCQMMDMRGEQDETKYEVIERECKRKAGVCRGPFKLAAGLKSLLRISDLTSSNAEQILLIAEHPGIWLTGRNGYASTAWHGRDSLDCAM